ncbi:MAG: sulfatase [Lentisphaeraceae bacterium]|nr:sulfatase [Lentisphaeraceae bacterium]
MKKLLYLFVLLFSFSSYASEKPNFLFILVDDLGWADLACYGSKLHETPNLDKFSKSSVRFTQGYAGGSVCSPTRASILTGRSPARLNITDWIPGKQVKNPLLKVPKILNELPHSEVTFAETLKESGYSTYYCGKWHLGHESHYPESQGFDVNIAGIHRGSPPGGYYSPYKNPKLKNGPIGEYLPDRLTNESIDILEKEAKSDSPFLLYLSYYTVHTPIQASKRHLEKYQSKVSGLKDISIPEHYGVSRGSQNNAAYASMVEAMDENIGRLLQKLEDLKLDKNTVIIFTSDNGGLSTKPTPGPTSNLPLKAGKGWCYEGGIRVPLIIRAPGVSKAGSTTKATAISMDFYPTILELAGIPQRKDLHKDGTSLVSVLKNPKEDLSRESLVWHYPHYHGSMWRPGAAIRSGKWKMIEFFETGKKELYNLENDLEEQHDLAKKMPEMIQELTKKMAKWRKNNNAQMPIKIK